MILKIIIFLYISPKKKPKNKESYFSGKKTKNNFDLNFMTPQFNNKNKNKNKKKNREGSIS